MNITREELLYKYKEFKELCNSQSKCKFCKYRGSEVCFVEFIFNGENCDLDDRDINSVDKIDTDYSHYKEVKVELVNGVVRKYEVRGTYFLEVKKYVITVIDIDNNHRVHNRKLVKRICLLNYNKDGVIVENRELWSK